MRKVVSLNEIIKVHSKLSEKLKRYEQATGHFPPVEVLSQLGYALRDSIQYLSTDDSSIKEDVKQKLYQDLVIAHYDLLHGLHVETTIFIDEIYTIEKRYVIQTLGDKRFEILELLDNVGKLIAKSRTETANRLEIYDSALHEEYFEKLLKTRKDIKDHFLPTLDSLEIEEKRRKKIDALKNISIGISAGIIVLLIGNFL